MVVCMEKIISCLIILLQEQFEPNAHSTPCTLSTYNNHKHSTHLLFHSDVTPASPLCLQLWTCSPLCPHWRRDLSIIVQSKLSSTISLDPWSKQALGWACAASWYPSCWHVTFASAILQESSHTVYHWPEYQISTLPSLPVLPLTRRTDPVE